MHPLPWLASLLILFILLLLEWQEGRICEVLEGPQRSYLLQFMNATCSASTDQPEWCLLDDTVHQLWWNRVTGESRKTRPSSVRRALARRAIVPSNPRVFSRLVYRDDCAGGRQYTEFIEPLVGHLRHPLACCRKNHFLLDRTWIVPPPHRTTRGKTYLFDAGASQWATGAGGPSLSYFVGVWKRNGIQFDSINAWEAATTANDFYDSVPDKFQKRTHYHQAFVGSEPNQPPFMPIVMRHTAAKRDYVLFKLDIDNGPVEIGTIRYLLSHPSDLALVDEIAWEHHVKNRYMARFWGHTADQSIDVAGSYQIFLKLRRHGVRAHSWV